MAKYCLDKLHPKKFSYFDYQIEDYFCENCSKFFNAQYSAYKSCLVRIPYYSSFVWP